MKNWSASKSNAKQVANFITIFVAF